MAWNCTTGVSSCIAQNQIVFDVFFLVPLSTRQHLKYEVLRTRSGTATSSPFDKFFFLFLSNRIEHRVVRLTSPWFRFTMSPWIKREQKGYRCGNETRLTHRLGGGGRWREGSSRSGIKVISWLVFLGSAPDKTHFPQEEHFSPPPSLRGFYIFLPLNLPAINFQLEKAPSRLILKCIFDEEMQKTTLARVCAQLSSARNRIVQNIYRDT